MLAPLAALLQLSTALDLDLDNMDSIKSATSTLAYDMMTYYSGNQSGQVPGLLPGPCDSVACYYWWEAGAMFGSLINYWQYTGDESYNPVVTQALQFQIGPEQNFNPPNQSKNMGVDDQDFWAFTAMDAAEAGFPDVGGEAPSWLALAQAVFNFQTTLWDAATCNGGMRWQVYSFNAGYNLKNTISNGGYFQLAARLARYTGNQTYADWAVKMYDWMEASPLFQTQDDTLFIWDNTDANNNCTDVQHFAWTYNYGTMLMGAASMYNFTGGAEPWGSRVSSILNGAFKLFFPAEYGGSIMSEFQCEATMVCNNDQSSFKAYLTRWMAVTAMIVPSTYELVMPRLRESAIGAARQCTGGGNGRMCGRMWYAGFDGSTGVGQQMQALAVIGATTIHPDIAPKTAGTGGTSVSDPGAGSDVGSGPAVVQSPITTADKAGAAILTLVAVGVVVGGSVWIIM